MSNDHGISEQLRSFVIGQHQHWQSRETLDSSGCHIASLSLLRLSLTMAKRGAEQGKTVERSRFIAGNLRGITGWGERRAGTGK